MNLNESRNGSITAATTERNTTRQEWYKNPTVFHIIISLMVVAVAFGINFIFMPNIFWKALIGFGLMWAGGKLAGNKNSVIGLWGKITRGIGAFVLIFTLIYSGIGVWAEKSVLWLDGTLKGQAATSEDGVTLPRFMSPSDTEEVLMGGAPVGTTENRAIPVNGSLKVHLGVPRQKSEGNYWPCLKAKGGFEPPLQFEVVRGAYTAVNTLKLTEESFLQAHRMGVKELNVVVVKASGDKNPCPQHLKAQ